MVLPLRLPRHLTSLHPSRPGLQLVTIALQPIIDVSTGRLVAAEALARFPGNPDGPVEESFALAYAAGRGNDLEAACLRAALRRRFDLPPCVLLTVNVSPDALEHPAVRDALDTDLTGVVVEVLEHAASHPPRLIDELDALRDRGALIAVDDTTSGYAGLTRLAALRPDIVKLDRALVTDVRHSLERTAVVEAIVSLCRRLGARVLGEGVESVEDLTSLAEMDVDYAQGMVIAPPAAVLAAPSAVAVAACHSARRNLLRPHVAPQAWFGDEGLDSVTAALAGSTERNDLRRALATAAARLRVDEISLSLLGRADYLVEVGTSAAAVDPTRYPVAHFPATREALTSGMLVEAHVDDPDTDLDERSLLAQVGRASMLMAPLIADGIPLGVLEFSQRLHRRWGTHEIAQARSLAEHVAHVLLRLEQSTQPPELPLAAGV